MTPLITALWVIGMTNAVNLIDGLDGLAAGVVAIASGALCLYGLRLHHLGDLLDGQYRSADRRHHLSGSASAFCPTTSTRPRSSWAMAERCSSVC